MRRAVVAAAVGLALVPVGARAATICAPSDPAGYYACASMSVQWVAGGVQLSVRNLDAWDATITNVVSGYRLWGVGIVGVPSLLPYLTGSLSTSSGPGAFWSLGGAGTQWSYSQNVQGIIVEAGAENPGAPGSIQGCTAAGPQGPGYYDSCAGSIVFTFGTNGLTEDVFNGMTFEFAMRGGVGPNDESFRCGPDDNACLPGQAVPEPMTMVLLGTGLAGLGGVARRRRKAGV